VDCKPKPPITLPADRHRRGTDLSLFSGSAQVHSGPGDVIKGQYRSNCPDLSRSLR
jgi:hypothetical protein